MNEEITKRLKAIANPVVEYIDDPVTFYRMIIQSMRQLARECLELDEENEEGDK